MGKEINWAVFMQNDNLEEIMQSIVSKVGQSWNGKNTLLIGNENCKCEIQVLCKFMGDQFKDYIKNLTNGISEHMLRFPVQDADDVKGNLMHFIKMSNTYIMVNVMEEEGANNSNAFYESSDNVFHLFADVLKEFGGGVIAYADGSIFYDENENVILAGDGECGVEEYFPFGYEESPEFLSQVTEHQMTRRNENMKFLFESKIFCIELPVNEDDEKVDIRSVDEITKRAVGVMLVSLYSECLLSPAQNMNCKEALEYITDVAKSLNIKDLKEVMSPCELQYVHNEDSTEQERIGYSWNYEHLYVLEWALGFCDWNMPVDICDVAGCVRILSKFSSLKDIVEHSTVRSKKEILDKADLIYRMDWACVDARIYGLTGPMKLDHGVTQARHKTLNWLFCMDGEEWDNVDTPT